MDDGFSQMVDSARSFLAELRDNNSKDWFNPRKASYEADIRKPAELFADLMSEDLARLTGQSLRPKVFRIYRDVRFSKDKTPLNTHLHLMWSDISGDPLAPTWFFGLSPDYFMLGTGLMTLAKEPLARFRAHIDTHGRALTQAVETSGASLSDWGPPPLKRVPKPYSEDHPQGALLKRKAFAVHAPIPDNWRSIGLHAATLQRVRDLAPVAQAMRPL